MKIEAEIIELISIPVRDTKINFHTDKECNEETQSDNVPYYKFPSKIRIYFLVIYRVDYLWTLCFISRVCNIHSDYQIY